LWLFKRTLECGKSGKKVWGERVVLGYIKGCVYKREERREIVSLRKKENSALFETTEKKECESPNREGR